MTTSPKEPRQKWYVWLRLSAVLGLVGSIITILAFAGYPTWSDLTSDIAQIFRSAQCVGVPGLKACGHFCQWHEQKVSCDVDLTGTKPGILFRVGRQSYVDRTLASLWISGGQSFKTNTLIVDGRGYLDQDTPAGIALKGEYVFDKVPTVPEGIQRMIIYVQFRAADEPHFDDDREIILPNIPINR